MNKFIKRINPLFDAEYKEIANSEESTKELASHNSLESVEICPICKQSGLEKKMEVLSCNGIPSYVCRQHRIAFPTRDE